MTYQIIIHAVLIASVAAAAWLGRKAIVQQTKISDQEDLITDLRAALGGANDEPWRKQTL